VVAIAAGRLLTPVALRAELPSAPWLLALAILLEWSILTALTRKWNNATPIAAMAVCFLPATQVLLLARCSPSNSERALLALMSLLGPAAGAWKWPSNTAPAAAAAAIVLPGLMLIGQQETESKVPLESFLLIGLAPLALAPLAISFVARRPCWSTSLVTMGLPLIVAMAGVLLAAQVESLDFSDVAMIKGNKQLDVCSDNIQRIRFQPSEMVSRIPKVH
jgi:hypothetical protein